MRNVMIFLVFILSLNAFAAKVESVDDGNTRPVRIGIYIDDGNESYCASGSNTITRNFAAEVHQTFLDIIVVSDYILKNMILRKYSSSSDNKITSINFNLNAWDIYHIENTQFFVFVQPGYNNTILNKTLKLDGKPIWDKIDFDNLEEYNGSESDTKKPAIKWKDLASINAKKLLSHESLIYIPYAKDLYSQIEDDETADINQHKKFIPIQLSWIFKPVKNYDKLNLSQPCNIYIAGHGIYLQYSSKEKSIISGISSARMANLLLFFNDKLNTKSIRISSCSSGGRSLDLMQIKKDVPIRIKYLLIIESITDASTVSTYQQKNDYPRVDIKKYFEALEEFQSGSDIFIEKLKAIKTKKRLLSGEAKKDITTEIQELEENSGFNGVLKSLPLTEKWYYEFYGLNNFPQIWIPEIGWFQTFTIDPYVKKITDGSIIKALAKPIFKVNALDHLEFDFNKTFQIDNCFAILLHSEIVYSTLNISPNVSKCVDVALLPMWLSNLYRYFPSIPCMNSICKDIDFDKDIDEQIKKLPKDDFYIYPQIISMQRGNSLNLFAKINILKNIKDPSVENGILNFLRDSFLILRGRVTSKKFFIKELEGFNDFSEVLAESDPLKKELGAKKLQQKQLTLENVFIETAETIDLENDPTSNLTNIIISFEFNGKAWTLVYNKRDLRLESCFAWMERAESLWHFEQNKTTHKKNLKTSGLSYLSKLKPIEYYVQLPIIRNMFHHKKTNIKIKNPASNLSLKDFISNLSAEDIQKEIAQTPIINSEEWKQFELGKNQQELRRKLYDKSQAELGLEQQFRLQSNLKRIKSGLIDLKEKLLILRSKLEQLKTKLNS